MCRALRGLRPSITTCEICCSSDDFRLHSLAAPLAFPRGWVLLFPLSYISNRVPPVSFQSSASLFLCVEGLAFGCGSAALCRRGGYFTGKQSRSLAKASGPE